MATEVDRLMNDLSRYKLENKEIIEKLNKYEAYISAIISGNVDAIVEKFGNTMKIFATENANEIYKLFVLKMSEGAVTLSEKGTVLYCNSRFSSMVNVPIENIIGSDFHFFIPDSSQHTFENAFARSMNTDVREELVISGEGGCLVPVIFSMFRLHFQSTIMLSIVITDLSEHHAAKKELEKSNQLLQIVNSQLVLSTNDLQKKALDLLRKQDQLEEAQIIAHIGNWEWDINSDIISWSDELFRIYGFRPQQFIPTLISALEYIHPEDKEFVHSASTISCKDKTPYSINYRIKDLNGNLRYLHEEVQVGSNGDGKIVKMYGIQQDITEKKGIENLVKEKHMAEQLSAAKDQFFSSMSHEIRTPLNSIIGFTKLLLRNGITEKQREQLQAVKSSSDILLVLINDILDLSKIEAGKIHFEETELMLSELIKTVTTSFELRFEEKEIVYSNKFDEHIPKILIGDPVRIEQILLNLINNAVKFTPEKGRINIELFLNKKDETTAWIEFIVSDTGTGIPEENLETIFDPFIQAANTTTSKYGGTGLGLGIVKKLVELMGGKVSVRSKLNEGSTFSFVLPLKITTAIEVSKESKILLRTQELGKIGRLKILLAEDNLLNQYLIESIMREYAFEVDTAENGRLAVELLENNSYDIILMDLMMPEMDGYEATKHIRTKMKLPKSRIPIIALTADVNKQVVLKSTKAGMNDYISKPFNEIELLNKISTLVKKSKYQKNGD
jgi:PAS domain S-box-containing protein